ncbi:MAG: hypothetical protein QNL39_08455, partial [Akkermansiaceae bacterium]
KTYMAYHFDSNKAVTRLSFREMHRQTIAQYAEEERTQMARRARAEKSRLQALLRTMAREDLAPMENLVRLRNGLGRIHKSKVFENCQTVGELTKLHIEYMLFDPQFSYNRKKQILG